MAQASIFGTKTQTGTFDDGLRHYMISIYNYMGGALLLTAIIAGLIGNNIALYKSLMTGGAQWLFILSPLIIVFIMSFAGNKLSTGALKAMLFLFAGLIGVSTSSIFIAYEIGDITRAFLITSCGFGGLSLYGYLTKRDLGPLGSFLFFGLIGLILAGLANLFIQSSNFDYALSIITVLIFAGMTAYDTQKIKSRYDHTHGDSRERAVIFGALSLYLDFINMFMAILRIMGGRR